MLCEIKFSCEFFMWSNFKASRQCVSSCEFAMHRESVGSVIVLLTAVWFFSDMLPHLVLS